MLHVVGFFFMKCTLMHGSTNTKNVFSIMFYLKG